MNNRYRVPKRRVPVRILLRGVQEESASLFLGERAETHAGSERPSDVLNGTQGFLAVESESGSFDVLSKDAISALILASELEEEGAVAAIECERSVELCLTLDDGRAIQGVARYHLPESARRLQDFLNQTESFLRLEAEGVVLLVNKRHIVRAREVRIEEEVTT